MKSWHARIDEVDDPMDLLSVCRDFLDSWGPEDLAYVPAHARPQRIKGVDDLSYWHERLVDCYCGEQLRDVQMEKVREMVQFFAIAVQRAGELDGIAPIGEHDAAARLFSDRSVPRLFTSAMAGVREP